MSPDPFLDRNETIAYLDTKQNYVYLVQTVTNRVMQEVCVHTLLCTADSQHTLTRMVVCKPLKDHLAYTRHTTEKAQRILDTSGG